MVSFTFSWRSFIQCENIYFFFMVKTLRAEGHSLVYWQIRVNCNFWVYTHAGCNFWGAYAHKYLHLVGYMTTYANITYYSPFIHNQLKGANWFQIVGGAEHTLRAKLTFSQESHGIVIWTSELLWLLFYIFFVEIFCFSYFVLL